MRLRLDAQLPPSGLARVVAVAMLLVGGAVAVGLCLLVLLYFLAILRG